jgi:hypothetical protein
MEFYSGITKISSLLHDQTNILAKFNDAFCVVGCKNNLVPSTIPTSEPHIFKPLRTAEITCFSCMFYKCVQVVCPLVPS